MIRFNKQLDYGVESNIDKRLLVIREIAISGSDEDIKQLLQNIAFFNSKIKNYNVNGVTNKDYDYYMWQQDTDFTKKSGMNYITLTYNTYKSVVECITDMQWLYRRYLKGLKQNWIDIEIVVKYNTIDNLVEKVKENIEFDKKSEELKRRFEDENICG